MKLIEAGNLAGQAIEITKTNMTHAISYPITSYYRIPHGMSVGWTIHPCAKYQECDLLIPDFEVNLGSITKDKNFVDIITREALKYDKIHDAKKNISEKQLRELLRKTL